METRIKHWTAWIGSYPHFSKKPISKKASQKSWIEKPFPLIPVRALKSTRTFERDIEIPLIPYQYFEKHSDACSGSTVNYSFVNVYNLFRIVWGTIYSHILFKMIAEYFPHFVKLGGLSGALSELTWNSFWILKILLAFLGVVSQGNGVC